MVLLGCAPLAGACEPILPLFMALGGPGAMAQSGFALLIAVLLKSALYGWFRRSEGFAAGFWRMAIANVFSSVIGLVVAALLVGAPATPVTLFGLLVLLLIVRVPAARLRVLVPWLRIPPLLIAVAIVAALFATVMLFGASQAITWEVRNGEHALAYWSLKLAYLAIAVGISLFLTVFWEDWAITWMTGAEEPRQLVDVFRAGYLTLIAVMLVVAVGTLPQRLKSHGFLLNAYGY